MKEFLSKNKVLVIILSIVLIISIGVLVYFGLQKEPKADPVVETKPNVQIVLTGEETIELNLKDEYQESGATILIDGVETDNEVEITGEVDNTTVGEYIITYKYEDIEVQRKVIIKDNVAPKITLKGAKKVVLVEGSTFKELGYIATDNIDGDLTDKVDVKGEVKKTIGTYTITYSVTDSSGNNTTAKRTVQLIKKRVVKQPPKEVKEKAEEKPVTYKNEVIDMTFINNGIRVIGTNSEIIDEVYLLKGEEKIEYKVLKSSKQYTANIDLSKLENDTYEVYIKGSKVDEKISNKLTNLLRIKRTKIGNKLVTFDYKNNNVQIKVEKFAYKYDILIDPGHGPTVGAVNSTHIERDVNLELSNYEKTRYEEHGLTVLMTRTGVNPSLGEGDKNWNELSRRSYAMGYYGVVSQIVYSNHHNSTTSSSRMGPEILVQAKLTGSQLASENKILKGWLSLNGISASSGRMYTRDYEDGKIYDKTTGKVVNINNYYAVLRIPYNLFNVKSVLYEPAYMSSPTNWNWYWTEENWKEMCEIKIKAYVEELGVTYKEPQ